MQDSIELRQYQASDIDPVWEAVEESRAALSRWMAWCHSKYSIDDVAEWVLGRAAAWEKKEDWGFVFKNLAGKLLGCCSIHRIDPLHQVGELGYWVRSSAVGQGCATEAARQLCRWAFSETELRRIEFLIAVENLASQRVAVKVGAFEEGRLGQRLLVNNTPQDCVLFAILKENFEHNDRP